MENFWMDNEELFNRHPELQKDLINTMIGMRAVLDLEKDIFVASQIQNDKLSRSYVKALQKSAIHAYYKRLCDFEEYRKPESLVAILQYEFQARMLLEKTKVPEPVKRYVQYVRWLISSFASRWKIELFEDNRLKMGFQHRCPACRNFVFSENILESCPDCKSTVIDLEEICTYPFNYEIQDGRIIQSKDSFCPSNGSEDKAIMSIKKVLGVE